MRILNHLVDTCQKVAITRNEYGDYIKSSLTTLSCMFRYIQNFRVEGNSEMRDADALIWFYPDANIENYEIILYDGVYYQVERIYKAKKLGSTIVEFIKCELKITDITIS